MVVRPGAPGREAAGSADGATGKIRDLQPEALLSYGSGMSSLGDFIRPSIYELKHTIPRP